MDSYCRLVFVLNTDEIAISFELADVAFYVPDCVGFSIDNVNTLFEIVNLVPEV
jgi:hypothetical protein